MGGAHGEQWGAAAPCGGGAVGRRRGGASIGAAGLGFAGRGVWAAWGVGVSWANLADVELQLRAAGLQFEPITGGDVGRFRRCRVDGMGREKRGWYKLVEIRLASGDVALVGAHGIYRGQDPGAQRLALSVDNQPLSDMQRKALAAQAREARAEATRRRQAEGDRAALRAEAVWRK